MTDRANGKNDVLAKKLRRFAFTWNNYTMENVDHLRKLTHERLDYLVVGFEVGEQNHVPHLQGYIEFNVGISGLSAIKVLDPNTFSTKKLKGQTDRTLVKNSKVSLLAVNGSRDDNIRYCKKEESKDPNFPEKFFEIIIREKRQGERTDFHRCVEMIDDGADLAQVALELPEIALKYHAGIERISEAMKVKKSFEGFQELYRDIELSPWQKRLAKMTKNPPSKTFRKIHWYYDNGGCRGKSTIAKWLIAFRGAIRFNITSGRDISSAYNGEPVVVFDFAREIEEKIRYGIIEALIDGTLFSGKYKSAQKCFNVPWVIVLANCKPDYGTMTPDRWIIHDLSNCAQFGGDFFDELTVKELAENREYDNGFDENKLNKIEQILLRKGLYIFESDTFLSKKEKNEFDKLAHGIA